MRSARDVFIVHDIRMDPRLQQAASVLAAGVRSVICVPLLTVNAAATPLNLAAVAPVNAEPVIVTCVPGAPLVGENDVIVAATGVAVATVGHFPTRKLM